MVELLFHLKIPIFVMRQHVRHRTASLNEYSGRYSTMSNEFYFPSEDREFGQSTTNKQKSEGDIAAGVYYDFQSGARDVYDNSYDIYVQAIRGGMSREIARIILPVANYTELYWKIDLHNFFHYIGLRNDPGHAQSEIVQLAKEMYDLVKPYVPISCQAFEDYRFDGISFSVQEQKALAELLKVDDFVQGSMDATLNTYLKGRELDEFKNKLTRIIERK
jgi:thymidylate synthase (FAD)